MLATSTDFTRTRIELDPVKFAASANARRTPGVHLTDVLRDIENVLGGGETRTDGTFARADLDRYALQGYLWEWAMTETLVDRVRATEGAAIEIADSYIRQPEIAISLSDLSHAFYIDHDLPTEIIAELTSGYVLCSPDGGCQYANRIALLECKWTTKSANMNPQRDKQLWFKQAPAYLLPMSIARGERILDVEWHVQMAVGSRWGEPPVYERWDKHYEPAEVMQVWAPIRPHIEWRIANGDPHGWGRYIG